MEIKMTKKVKEGVTIFYLEGKLDFFKAPSLEAELINEIKNNSLSAAVISLKKVSFLDSLGIGSLLSVIRKTKASTVIRMCDIANTIIHVLKFTGLTGLMLIDKTEEESIEKIKELETMK